MISERTALLRSVHLSTTVVHLYSSPSVSLMVDVPVSCMSIESEYPGTGTSALDPREVSHAIYIRPKHSCSLPAWIHWDMLYGEGVCLLRCSVVDGEGNGVGGKGIWREGVLCLMGGLGGGRLHSLHQKDGRPCFQHGMWKLRNVGETVVARYAPCCQPVLYNRMVGMLSFPTL